MRPVIVLTVLALSSPLPAMAQYSPQYGVGGIVGSIFGGIAAQQERAAREQARAAHAYQQQQIDAERAYRAQQAEAEAAARQAAAERDQAATRQQAAVRARQAAVERERRAKDAEAAQLAAERSPDNHCAEPEFARAVLEGFNSMDGFKARHISVVDIEHVTTTTFSTSPSNITCHGEFMINNGQRWKGSLALRKNIAGDPMVQWKMDQ